MRSGNRYLKALASPGALRFSAAGFLGRMTMSMYGLGTILLIVSIKGRYGLAGGVAAAVEVGYAVASPQAARLADRFGQGRVLRPLVLVFALATGALVGGAEIRAPEWALLVCGGLAGAATPPVGSMVRARWSALLGGSELMHTAFSLESVADEVIFVAGPALVTLLATAVYPASGISVAAVACVAGALLLAAQRRTEPPLRPADLAPAGAHQAPAGGGPARGRLLAAPGLATLLPVYLLFGALLAAIDVSTVAFAQEHGHKPLAGLILGGYSLGSAAGGLWYGARTFGAPMRRRFAIALAATAAGTATFWAMPGLAALAVDIVISGVPLSAVLISGFSLVEKQAPAARRTEGMAVLTSAISVGVAVGSAAGGQVVDAAGARWGYVFAAACGAAAVLTCLLGLGRLSPPDPGTSLEARAVSARP